MNKLCPFMLRLTLNRSITLFSMEGKEELDMDYSEFSKRAKLTEEDYYISDEGFIVFTEAYHLKRGYCCKSNCKHCPYGYNSKTDRIIK